MINYYAADSGMKINRKDQSYPKKSVSKDLTWFQTWATAVGKQQLTKRAVAYGCGMY
jgi:hypothetical protein